MFGRGWIVPVGDAIPDRRGGACERRGKCYNCGRESHPLMPRKTTRKSAARAPRPAARSSAEGMSARLSAWVNRNPYSAAVALLFAFAAYLALNNLNYVGFWDDEAASAILSRNFLEFGVPTAWTGATCGASATGARWTRTMSSAIRA